MEIGPTPAPRGAGGSLRPTVESGVKSDAIETLYRDFGGASSPPVANSAQAPQPVSDSRFIPARIFQNSNEIRLALQAQSASDSSPFGARISTQHVGQGGRGVTTRLSELVGDAADPTKNTITITNRSNEAGSYSFYQNEQPYVPGANSYASVVLQPGESKTITLPTGWAGYMQKLNGQRSDPHTRVEVAFNQWRDLTFSNLSYEDGNNAAMLLRSGNEDRETGSDADLIARARAEGLTSFDSSGREVIGFAEGQGDVPVPRIVDFYRRNLQRGKGYVLHGDDESSGGSSDKRVIVDVY